MKKAKKLPVGATITDDQQLLRVPFDCADWFEQASDANIRAVLACHEAGDSAADAVAVFFDVAGHPVKDVFDLVAILNNNPHCTLQTGGVGYRVDINAEQARAWVARHKPHLLKD